MATGIESDTTTGIESDTQEINIKDNKEIYALGDFQSPPVPDNSKTPNKEIDVFFETVWKLYPRKQGKGKVSKSQKCKLFKIGFEEMSRCIERYIQYIKANSIEAQFVQYGSSFFNTGYMDYLDANYLQGGGKKALPPISNDPKDWSGF